MLPKSYDILGNIVILKFKESVKKSDKVKIAKELLKERKSVKTVLEKSEKVKGRLRTIKTNYLAGEKNKEAFYIENNCRFKFNIEACYFSPRLSNERKEIFSQVKKNEMVLVMFAGVAPFSITIAKNAKPKEVYSVELGKKCSRYAEENVKLNKLKNVKVIQGDVKKIIPKFVKEKLKFDRVVMPRPNLKETFLNEAFKVCKNGGIINYYGFSHDENEILKSIKNDAKKYNKKIKIIRIKKAGDIAPGKFRWRVDLMLTN